MLAHIKMNRYIFTYLIVIFSLSVSGQINDIDDTYKRTLPEINFVDYNKIESFIFNENPDSLYAIKPMDYLRYLGTTKYIPKKDKFIEDLSVHMIPFKFSLEKKWLTENDIDSLIHYVKSKEIARMPFSLYSSTAPLEKTTIGIEAMHLINLYKTENFIYPSLCSVYYFCKPADQDKLADEYIKWWTEKRDN
jgi:hypothetical protein